MNHALYDPHETDRMRELEGAPLASFTARAAAFAIDMLVCFTLFDVVLIGGDALLQRAGLITHTENVVVQFNLEHWYSLVFIVVYFGLLNYWTNGRTLGKWLLRIRAVSVVHERLTLWQSFERALGYGASFLEFGFGFIQYFIHPNRRTVHDRIAETIVIRDAGRTP